jgi:hypothetical protein
MVRQPVNFICVRCYFARMNALQATYQHIYGFHALLHQFQPSEDLLVLIISDPARTNTTVESDRGSTIASRMCFGLAITRCYSSRAEHGGFSITDDDFGIPKHITTHGHQHSTRVHPHHNVIVGRNPLSHQHL